MLWLSICAGLVLRTNEAPKYHHAFLALSVVSLFSLPLVATINFQYIWSNRKLELKYPLFNFQAEEENVAEGAKRIENNNIIIIVGFIIDEEHRESLN